MLAMSSANLLEYYLALPRKKLHSNVLSKQIIDEEISTTYDSLGSILGARVLYQSKILWNFSGKLMKYTYIVCLRE